MQSDSYSRIKLTREKGALCKAVARRQAPVELGGFVLSPCLLLPHADPSRLPVPTLPWTNSLFWRTAFTNFSHGQEYTLRAGKMAQWVKVPAAKAEDWSLSLRTHLVGENQLCRLSSDLHTQSEIAWIRRRLLHMTLERTCNLVGKKVRNCICQDWIVHKRTFLKVGRNRSF